MNEVLTMKRLVINCLAAYGAYRLVSDYVIENYGIEVVVHKKNDIQDAQVVPADTKKKGWTFSVSR